jgi:23S rRNA (uracil1939-C5)-methyltransferase
LSTDQDPAEIVRIESVTAGGDGVGRLADGIAVFVPRTAPGDRVRVGRVRRRRRHAHAVALSVVEPGPDRVTPRCAHFLRDACGGCQWQHLSSEAQCAAKRRIVGDALRRIGGMDVADPELVPSRRSFGYRATVTLTARWTAGGPVVGFHSVEGPVFPLEHCDIAREELDTLWAALRPALGTLPRGEDVRLKLRIAPDGALHVVVSGGEGAWATPEPLAEAAKRSGQEATIWWQPGGGRGRGAARRLAGPVANPAAVAFEQVNAEVAAALHSAVEESVPVGCGRVLDLYAGAGEVSVALARRGYDVCSVEVHEPAVRRAAERARLDGVRLEALVARVEDVVEQLLPAEAVIVNPPRTGLAPAVASALSQRPPARLVYVSCDPATLARDLRRLGAAPARLAVRCFDMLPQTSHVETLAVLARA